MMDDLFASSAAPRNPIVVVDNDVLACSGPPMRKPAKCIFAGEHAIYRSRRRGVCRAGVRANELRAGKRGEVRNAS